MKEHYKSIASRSAYALFVLLIVGTSVALLATPYYKFAVLPGVLLLLMLLLGRYPQAGFYLIVFLIPFDAYRALSPSYQYLTISKLVGIWIIIVVLFNFIFNKRQIEEMRSVLWKWLILFFVVNIISTLMSRNFYSSLLELQTIIIPYFFFALSLILITERGFYKTLPVILIVSVSIGSFLLIIGYIFDIPLFTYGLALKTLKRGIGTSRNPNVFAMMVIFTLPLLSHWFFSSRRTMVKLSVLAAFIMNVVAIILTYSRSGAILLSLVLLILLFWNLRRFRPRYLGFVTSAALIALLATIAFMPSGYWKFQKTVTDTMDRSIGARTSYLIVGWRIFKEDPIIGSGPGTFAQLYSRSEYAAHYADIVNTYLMDAHNSYLEVVVGTGLLGLSIFLIIIWTGLRNFHLAQQRFRADGREDIASLVGAYSLSYISIVLYFLVFSGTYHKYFWLSLGLSQVALNLSRKKAEGDQYSGAL
ncbi:O-Antigen ligase [bacterium BMS3Abin08]|nr:O-Antigen ligase [bacterium BMS3Abin08]